MEYYSELCLPPDQLLAGYGGLESYSVWTGGGEEAEYAPRAALLADGGHRFGVSAVAFDKYEELVWMGNQGGHVTSYYGADLQKYTSFQVHESEEVRHISTLENGILALTNTSLRHQIRRGIPRHTHRSDHMRDMQCLLQLSGHRVLMGGHQDQLLDLDLNTMQETVVVEDAEGCAVMRSSGGALVACGGTSGAVVLRDMRCPARTVHRLRAHTACLSDLDMQGDLLITAGFCEGAGGQAEAEQYALVWDVRRLRSGRDSAGAETCAWSVPLPAPPLLLHFVPAVSGRAVAVAADGRTLLFNVNEMHDDDTRYSQFQVDTQSSPCTVFDISATSQALVFGDAAGHVHLYCPHHNTHPIFNNFSRETEFAEPPEHLPRAPMSDESFHPSSIPLPPLASGQHYLSYWPHEFIKTAYRKPKPIDPKVLSTMKMQGPIGYAPNPRTSRRNEMPYLEEPAVGADSPKHADLRSAAQPIPNHYLKVEMRYSKHGAEGEDLNKTNFPGLEATLPNSYCNPMLQDVAMTDIAEATYLLLYQVLYYTVPVKKTLLSHSCVKEFCLTCELGFLFRMLDTSSGAPCQASNFLRAFRTVPEAAALGLILPDRSPAPYSTVDLVALIQNWNRFILHQMHLEILETRKKEKDLAALTQRSSPLVGATIHLPHIPLSVSGRLVNARLEEAGVVEAGAALEGREETELAVDALNMMSLQEESVDGCAEEREESEISELFGIAQSQLNTCLKCDKEEERQSVVLACALQYPSAQQGKGAAAGAGGECGGFLPLLKAALVSRKTTPAWCDTCQRFSPTSQQARLVRLPPILTINFGGVVAHEKAYWKKGVSKENTEVPRRSASGGGSGGNKPCRYGVHCARPGCRFKHPDSRTIESGAWQTGGGGDGVEAGVQCVIPLRLKIGVLPDGDIAISDQDTKEGDESEQEGEGEEESVRYDLKAAVVCVERSRNMVAYICIEQQWYLFNDTSIVGVSAEEVKFFGAWWKSPCVLFYMSRSLDAQTSEASLGAELGPGQGAEPVFTEEGRDSVTSHRNFTPLAPHEMPTPGTLVGMDAEFVTLNSEQVEVRSDGQRSTLRPSHMSVARITCVRGEGPLEGVPFIDDYISTQEQVVDYLTKFSGIKPGDLDANFSSKHLTTLKSTYRKLRSLVDSGVVFVGHGLNNDFRVINLVVPPEQVVDTVQLFHLPHHRMVSLKFLAWHFLGVHIQSETHDSVEDARTALRLRRKWAELGAAGELRAALQELYSAGDAVGWRVPQPHSFT